MLIHPPGRFVVGRTREFEVVDGDGLEWITGVDDHVRHQCPFQFLSAILPEKGTDFRWAEPLHLSRGSVVAVAGGSRQLSHEDLLALARELGVSEDAVEQVLADRAKRRKRQSRRRGALIGLAAHGMSYCIVMSGLAIVDMMSGPGWWFQWPAVAWGMGLAFHVMGLVLGAMKRAGTE